MSTFLGIWRLADPKISLASFAGLLLGTAAAAGEGPLSWGWLALTVAGIFSLEVAKNASGDLVDWRRGVDQKVAREDRSPFSGGKRVILDGLLTPSQTRQVALAAYILGSAAGLVIGLFREPGILFLGAAGTCLALFYHAAPLYLSYRGFGELAVALCYGPGITAGTYLVQRGELPLRIVALGAPLGILVAAFLWINEFPDYLADRAAGKRTLVVRLGRRRAARAFGGLVGLAFAFLLALPLAGLHPAVYGGLAGLPPAVAAALLLLRHPEETARIIPAQGWTLLAFLLLAGGASLGLGLAA